MRSTSPLTAIAWTAALLIRRPIALRPETIQFMHRQPSEVLAGFRNRMADHPDLLVADDDAVVARFEGKAGPLPYRTIEMVRFSADEITFEHLRGPFIRCEEAFQLQASEHGTAVTHVGTFTMRGGLLGWAAGRLWIGRLFEQHVADELARMATADGA